jgi:tetratricopeptide (TPR) repeat protein
MVSQPEALVIPLAEKVWSCARRDAAWAILLTLSLTLCAPAANGAESAASPAGSEEARELKSAGDGYVKRDELDKAADAYIRALDRDRKAFSADERTRMAIYLSWADRLGRAEEELWAVLESEATNSDARTHLARVLSWKGDLREAIEQADRVLKQDPDQRDALQIKADALQWRGDLRRAIPIYRELLGKQDSFDARLGLSQALLAAGERVGALDASRSLSPATVNQKNRFGRFRESFDAAFRPKLDVRYSYFSDSDKNRLDRYSVSPSFWLGNFHLAALLRHTEAEDDNRSKRAEEFSLKAYTNLNESFGIGGNLGITHLGRGSSSTFPTGGFRLDTSISGGKIGASATHEVLTDSAGLIDNEIKATIAALQWTQHLTDRFAVTGVYRYGSFSDSNHAHDAQATSQYTLWFNPKITVGHRFRYLNYQRQSGGGYFDPNDYYSNRGFVSVYAERERFYGFADIFVGQQAFKRNGVATKDLIFGGSASLGVKPMRQLAVEFNIEGGQLASGTSAGPGYSYLILGPRLLIRF